MSYHTFKFLRKRRKDPRWKEEYQIALLKRIIAFLFSVVLFSVFYAFFKRPAETEELLNTWLIKIQTFVESFF